MPVTEKAETEKEPSGYGTSELLQTLFFGLFVISCFSYPAAGSFHPSAASAIPWIAWFSFVLWWASAYLTLKKSLKKVPNGK